MQITSRISKKQIRNNRILETAVESYIKRAHPISSKFLCEHYDLDVSPATVRNAMAELKNEGYLRQDYFSAGRVPTQKAYRYYINYLMKKEEVDSLQRRTIKDLLPREFSEPEELFYMIAELISNVTHSAGFHMSWRPIKLYYTGTRFILEAPEFHDLKILRGVISILEDRDKVAKLISDTPNQTTRVYVGEECRYPEIKECALVVSSYCGKRVRGKIAVLGPARLNYPKVIGTLNFISKELNRIIRLARW